LGAALCDPIPPEDAGEASDGESLACTGEDRLFFDYLRGDFESAAADLEVLAPRITSPRHRLALLSLRAQVFWSLGATNQAKAVVNYLQTTEGRPIRRVEDTLLGPVVTNDPDPRQTWLRYLSERIAEAATLSSAPRPEVPVEPLDPFLGSPFVAPAPEAPLFERGGGAAEIPFIPIPRDHQPGVIRQRLVEPVQPEPPPRPLPVRPMDLQRRPPR
jgi:hypothetical protein